MTGIKCSNCGTENEQGQLVCIKCGILLFNPSASTVHMRIDPTLLRLRRPHEEVNGVEMPENTVLLTVRGMSERLIFEEGTEIVLGRTDPSNPGTQRLDLSRYGAHERGVSREHALLHFSNNQLTVTDLKTVNGTSVNQKRLDPNKPHVLKSGDELMVGTLTIVVHFEPRVSKTPELKEEAITDEASTRQFSARDVAAAVENQHAAQREPETKPVAPPRSFTGESTQPDTLPASPQPPSSPKSQPKP